MHGACLVASSKCGQAALPGRHSAWQAALQPAAAGLPGTCCTSCPDQETTHGMAFQCRSDAFFPPSLSDVTCCCPFLSLGCLWLLPCVASCLLFANTSCDTTHAAVICGLQQNLPCSLEQSHEFAMQIHTRVTNLVLWCGMSVTRTDFCSRSYLRPGRNKSQSRNTAPRS